MRHPELLYIASDRCHISLLEVIHGAFERRRFHVNRISLLQIKERFLRSGDIPEFIEDHALYLLAKHERDTKLPNNYNDWIRK